MMRVKTEGQRVNSLVRAIGFYLEAGMIACQPSDRVMLVEEIVNELERNPKRLQRRLVGYLKRMARELRDVPDDPLPPAG